MDQLPRIALTVEKTGQDAYEWALLESTGDTRVFSHELARSPHAFDSCVRAARAGSVALVVALESSSARPQ